MYSILPPPPSLNVTAFRHRFNTETLILLHFSLHIFGIHLHSTVVAMSSWIHCIATCASLAVSCLPVASYMNTFSYVALDTAVTKMQILTLLEV